MIPKYPRIEKLRKDAHLSQQEMGKILNISQRAYSHYETGSRGIPLEILWKLADYYHTSIDYLVGHTDRKTSR